MENTKLNSNAPTGDTITLPLNAFTEKYDKKRIEYLLSIDSGELIKLIYDKNARNKDGNKLSPDEYINYVKSYLLEIFNNDCSAECYYNQKKNNRLYSSKSAQMFQYKIRGFLLNNHYDYDIINCHFQILLHVCKDLNISCPQLQMYCSNREDFLIKSKSTKLSMIIALNSDVNENKMNESYNLIINEFSEIKNQILLKSKFNFTTENVKNPISSKINRLLCYHENLILNRIISKYSEQVSVLMFDGFMSSSNIPIDELNKLCTDYNITWKIKPNDESIKLPSEFNVKILPKLENHDESMSNIFLYFQNDNLIYQNDNLYIFENNTWTLDDGKIIKKIIRVTLNKHVSKIIKKQQDIILKTEDDNEKKVKIEYSQTLNKIQLRLTNKKTIDNILEFSLQTLAYESQNQKIEFDVGSEQLYNLHFKNGCYELNNKIFRKRKKSDYITKFLDWSYNPIRDESKIAFIKNEFKKIQPNPIHLNFTLGWLAYCLNGDTGMQKMKMNIGYSAGNGKSTEFKIHAMVFDIYTHKLDKRTFEDGFTKTHKQFYKLISEPIRLAYMEELSRKKLDVDLLKEVVDGDSLNVEIMYGTSVQKPIQCVLSTCSNKDFNINSPDAGILRRGLVQEYLSEFRESYEDDYVNHKYKTEINFENRYKNDKYKNAYLQLLLDNYDNKDFIPKECSVNFKNIVAEYDTFQLDFENIFEITNNANDIMNRIDVLDLFNESANAKMKWKDFLAEMKRITIKYDRSKVKKHVKGCFIGVKAKTEDEGNCLF